MRESKQMMVWMALFLAVAALICGVLFPPLASAFAANRVFNGLILGVLLIGIVINFIQVLRLEPASAWIDDRERGIPAQRPPRLLAPMARMFRSREEEGFRLSAMAMRSLLDGVRLRLDEARDIARYMVGLLIFLGLLGTFWGLLDTVGGVARVISGLSIGAGDMSGVFDALKRDLQGPLSGMGTAFSSSLFGLGGAVILGVLDLQAGHAQNRFYNRLEEWLSGMTHLPSGKGMIEGDQLLPTYIEALLEQTAENLEQLQRTMTRGEEDRRAMQGNLDRLTEQLAALTDQLRAEQRLTLNLAKNQTDLQSTIAALANQMSGAFSGYEQIRDHLRSADVSLSRLVKEVSLAREQVPEEMRKEFRLLVQSVGRDSRTRP
ncbi:MAG: flagellar motor protein MotA [Betaproteobacteria bacterium RIFCSPLOWO2_12_FULL_62_13]|nr:MAG: flagellar motor protein MotA [Betaproteobacteria bacterium RIFCSPLOWO2_12_FULL_62_13]